MTTAAATSAPRADGAQRLRWAGGLGAGAAFGVVGSLVFGILRTFVTASGLAWLLVLIELPLIAVVLLVAVGASRLGAASAKLAETGTVRLRRVVIGQTLVLALAAFLAVDSTLTRKIRFPAYQCGGHDCNVQWDVQPPSTWNFPRYYWLAVGVMAALSIGLLVSWLWQIGARAKAGVVGIPVGLALVIGLAGGLVAAHHAAVNARNTCEWVNAVLQHRLPFDSDASDASHLRTPSCRGLPHAAR